MVKFHDINTGRHEVTQEGCRFRSAPGNLNENTRSVQLDNLRSGYFFSPARSGRNVTYNLDFKQLRVRSWPPKLQNALPGSIFGICSMVYERDPRTDVFEVTQNVRGDQNRNSLNVELLQLLTQVNASQWIETGGRFIQQQYPGVMEKRLGKE